MNQIMTSRASAVVTASMALASAAGCACRTQTACTTGRTLFGSSTAVTRSYAQPYDARPYQSVQRVGTQDRTCQTVFLPTAHRGSSVLLLEQCGPAFADANSGVDYEIRVTNLTNDQLLKNVVVINRFPEYLRPEAPGAGPRDAMPPQTRPAEGPEGDRTNPEGQQSAGTDAGVPMRDRAGNILVESSFPVGDLRPGETQTVFFTGVAHQAGPLHICATALYELNACLDTDIQRGGGSRGTAMQDECAEPQSIKVDARLPREPIPGAPLEVEIKVTNRGNKDARGLLVEDMVPVGVELLEASHDGRHRGDAVEWHLDELPAGESVVLGVRMRADRSGRQDLNNVISVSDRCGTHDQIELRAPLTGGQAQPNQGFRDMEQRPMKPAPAPRSTPRDELRDPATIPAPPPVDSRTGPRDDLRSPATTPSPEPERIEIEEEEVEPMDEPVDE